MPFHMRYLVRIWNFENVLRFSIGCFRHTGDYLGCESEGLLLTFLFIENVQERET